MSVPDEFDTAQICLNGHVTNPESKWKHERNVDYCAKCGAKTITSCPACQHHIRGRYINRGRLNNYPYTRPNFCTSCGEEFPWTSEAVKEAQRLASELSTLSAEERQILGESITDIVKDTPAAGGAALRFKQLVNKAGNAAATAFRDILVDVMAETAKRSIYGG